ncbi:zinc finger protein 431-like [Rhopalosiphum padi]|uniref:zinc finger protein 431-like n=1 Tax=Rhopalosiphum padi TaxID=40932 RepID=UPI00298D9B0D|nr:zinc finger protein 431-like [Rhopalosiphum padi]
MDNDILDERSREFLETADQYITEHGHQHVSEENSKQLVSDQHNLPDEFRIDENGELSHHTTGYYDTSDILSGDGSTTLTEDDHRLANELAAELAQQNKSLVDGGHHDTHLMTSYLYSTDFDLNTNSKHSSQTSSHINNQQIISTENLIEVETSESDYHAEIQNNLPHKKRFRKRESAPAPLRSIHPKCYKCKQCGEQFNSQSAVTAHKPVHAPKKVSGRMPFLCEICDKHFTHQIKFFEHLKFHYEPQQSKVIVVTTDSGTSPHHVNYQNHNVQESADNNENQYIEETIENQPELHDLPPLQSYRLTEEESMEDDKHCIFSSDGSILAAQLQQPFPSCHLCGRNFRRLKALEIHMASVHPQPATVVTVKQDCLEEFSDPEDLMEGIRHMVPGVADTESETDEKQPIQDQIWEYNGESITNHEDTMIKPKEENNCLMNGNGDNGENSRAEHTWEDDTDELEQIMKKNISKNLVCTQCKRKFNHRNSLLYHLRSHSGKRPHSCKLCPKSFFSSSALKVHNRLHTGDKPFECEWCGRNFRQWGDLKYHIASLHSESKQFQCEFCGKDFARKYSLIVHRRIHTGEKNYVCEFCKKTFRASSYLQNHRRIHTGEKPYKCDTCGKAFRVRSDMRRHTVVHRKDVVNSVQINSYAGQVSGIVTSSDMSIHLTKLEVNKDKITTESDGDVKFHENFPHDSNQILTADEVSTPLNLNLRAQDNGDNDESTNFEQFNGRQEIIDRETNTLYVWIPSNTEQLLQSE